MGESEAVKKSKIFIMGQVGEKLKEIDPERLLSIIEANPNAHLFNSFRYKLRALREELENSNIIQASLIKDKIKAEIQSANIFREIGKYVRDGMDELSTGSLVLGEVKNPEAEQSDIFEDEEDTEED